MRPTPTELAARRIGITPEVYDDLRARNLRWCWMCREFHPVDCFGNDADRPDGIATRCLRCARAMNRARRARRMG